MDIGASTGGTKEKEKKKHEAMNVFFCFYIFLALLRGMKTGIGAQNEMNDNGPPKM